MFCLIFPWNGSNALFLARPLPLPLAAVVVVFPHAVVFFAAGVVFFVPAVFLFFEGAAFLDEVSGISRSTGLEYVS